MADQPTIQLDVNDFAPAAESTVVEQPTPTVPSTDVNEAAPVEPKTEAPAEVKPVETDGELEVPKENDPLGANEEEPDETPTGEEELPKGKMTADQRKEVLSQEIRALNSQKAQLERDIALKNAQAGYRPQTAAELAEQGMDPVLARIEEMDQTSKMNKYNSDVAQLNSTLLIEANEVMRDFPVFDPDSEHFDAALSKRVGQIYLDAAKPVVDPRTGLTVSSNVLPYQIYKAFAETHATGAQSGQVAGQKATEKMLAAAETPSSSAPKAPKVDPFLAGLTRGLPGH